MCDRNTERESRTFEAALLLIDSGLWTDLAGLAVVAAVWLPDRRKLKRT